MRSLVLLLVIGFAFSLVVPTVRSFLAQRAELAALEHEVAQARALDVDLQAELARWDDPAFEAAQARERLAYVLPGEVAYRVIDPHVVADGAEEDEPIEPETPASGILTPATDRPWFESVWDSVQVAGGIEGDEQAGDENASDDDAGADDVAADADADDATEPDQGAAP